MADGQRGVGPQVKRVGCRWACGIGSLLPARKRLGLAFCYLRVNGFLHVRA
jgi:hypothetical protein